MSSETSISSPQVRLPPSPKGFGAPGKPDTTGESDHAAGELQPWQLFTLAGLIGATVVVFVSRGQTPAGIILLSLTIFTAAAVGVAAWRTFSPFAAAEESAPPPVIGGRTRAALERDKALVLRSIKELEFDRAMGKVSARDFEEMSGRLRARAARLLGQLDAGLGYRQQIEQEVATRVASQVRPADTTDVRAVVHRCPACGTENDGDARFCKHCGASLEPSE